ncbi:MAG: cation:proton antiporter, partial [Methanoregula sp.]
MIVALLGLEAGIIGQGVYVALVLMSLLTTIITPIIYRNWFFKGERADDENLPATNSGE